MGHCPNFTLAMPQHFPNQWGNYGTRLFSNLSCTSRPVRQSWHTEIVNKILHLRVKVMSHCGEALVKHDRKVCDFCPIITPLDYILEVYLKHNSSNLNYIYTA